MKESSSEYIMRISKEYGLYILDNRAIPSMFDGLKTGQRIALWLMRNKRDKIKTMALAGEMIASELYVHGDAAASDSISLLAARFLNNQPLLQGIGGFGSRTERYAIGAPRYTYVKRNAFAQRNLYTDLDVVPMVDNHDGSNRMPATFLPTVPLVLLNGVRGTTTGWATRILPRSYSDLVRAVLEVLQTGEVQTKLMPCYERYDVDVREESPGRYVLSGRAGIKNTSTVLVTELPPEISLETYRGRLDALEKSGKIVGFTDRSKRQIDITVKFQRAVLAELDAESVLDYLRLRDTITEHIVVLGTNGVREYRSAEELVKDWVDWRVSWYQKRYEDLVRKDMEELWFLRSYIACYEGYQGSHGTSFDSIPKYLYRVESKANLRHYMQQVVQVNGVYYYPPAIDRLVELSIHRWTQDGYEAVKLKEQELLKQYEDHQAMADSPKRQREVFEMETSLLIANEPGE